MKTEIDTNRLAAVFPQLAQVRFNGTAPSLRLPVTSRNRALLRWLRSAELSAWQDADIASRRLMRRRPDPTAQFCVA